MNFYVFIFTSAPYSPHPYPRPQLQDLVPSFVSILKQITEHRLPRDFDYHRMPAPWIQMRLLRILALLGRADRVTRWGPFFLFSFSFIFFGVLYFYFFVGAKKRGRMC